MVLLKRGAGDGHESIAEDKDVDEEDQDVGDDTAELPDVGLSFHEAADGVGDVESIRHAKKDKPPESVWLHVAEKAD